MSKKQIKNQLDKLFKNIKEEEIKTSEQSSRRESTPIPHISKPAKRDGGSAYAKKEPATAIDLLDIKVDVTDAYSTMSLPLRMDTDSWGTLQLVDENTQREWGAEEQMLVQQVAEQLSLALENARLFEETQQRNKELNILNEVISAASQSLNLDISLREVLETTLEFMNMDSGLISMFNSSTNKLELSININIPEPLIESIHQNGFEKTLCGYVYHTGAPLISNLPENKTPLDISGLIANNLSAYVGVPLIARDTTVGTLSMFHSQTLKVSESDIALLDSIGRQVGLAIENARLFQETKRRTEELAIVNRVTTAVSSSLELDTDLQIIAKEVSQIVSALHVGITLLDEEKENLVLVADYPENPSDLGYTLPVKDNLAGKKVIETHEPFFMPNIPTNPMSVGIREVMKERNTESLVIFPLLSGNEVIGTLGVDFSDPSATLSQNQTELIQTILLQASTSIETARLFGKTQESETEFRALFAAMEDVIFVVDKDSRYLRIAPTKTEGLYRLPEELLGKRMDEIMPEKEHLFFRDAIQKALASDETINIEYPLEIEGQEIWFDASLSKLGKDQVYWVARDITERKQTEKALEDAHARIQLVLETTTVPTHITRISDEVFLYANQAVSEALRMPLDEVMKRNATSFYYSDEDKEKFLSAINEHGIVFNMEIRFIRGNGEMFWGLVSSRLFEYEGDEALLSTVLDITERKETEKILQRQNEYMAAAAEVGRLVTSTLDTSLLFKRAVTLLPEYFGYYHAAIFTTVEAGAGFNVTVREATGEAGEAMKEKGHLIKIGSESVVGIATETGEPYIVNDVSKSTNHLTNPLLPNTKAEAAIPLKIGRRIIGALDLQSTEVDAFTDEDIEVLQLLADQFATAMDNARSYKLAQESFKEMRELESLKSQFLANMSHELRTPLNSIIGFSRVILKGIDGPITDLQSQDLTAIYNSGQHLLGLINDILDFSKIEAGKMELSFEEIDIANLIKSVMSTVMGLIKDKPVRLEEELEADLPTVKADTMRVRQILINLFSNASKFTDEGTIKVTAQKKGSSVLISVIDSGPGISKKDQEKLFQAFSQVDASVTRATGGSGLGLSISKQLVTMHGGEIGLESEEGEGSTFFFTLPIYDNEEVPAKIAPVLPPQEDSPPPYILAIDDDEKVISLYQRYLKEHGYQIFPLTDSSKAVERAKALAPYAITLDIMIPKYDGWQVLKDLKSDPETCNIPVIICSIVEETEKGYALGAADYLLKPILDDDLINALNRLKKEDETS